MLSRLSFDVVLGYSYQWQIQKIGSSIEPTAMGFDRVLMTKDPILSVMLDMLQAERNHHHSQVASIIFV